MMRKLEVATRIFLYKKLYWKISQYYMKATVLESLINNVEDYLGKAPSGKINEITRFFPTYSHTKIETVICSDASAQGSP